MLPFAPHWGSTERQSRPEQAIVACGRCGSVSALTLVGDAFRCREVGPCKTRANLAKSPFMGSLW